MTVSLKKMTEADSPHVIQWRNADAACFGDSTPLSARSHYEWYEAAYVSDPRDHMYVILHDGVPAGTIGMRLHVYPGMEIQRVLLGKKELARTGVMSEALNLLISVYGHQLYWLKVRADNEPAIRFYRKNGFTVHQGGSEWLTMKR